MLTLPRQLSEALRLTPARFAELCAANPEAVLELAADGRLIEMTPAGGKTGRRNKQLALQLGRWALASRPGACSRLQGASCCPKPPGFCAAAGGFDFGRRCGAAGAPAGPDFRAGRQGFPPLCPDLWWTVVATIEITLPDALLRGKKCRSFSRGD